jgi:hypothetical protein
MRLSDASLRPLAARAVTGVVLAVCVVGVYLVVVVGGSALLGRAASKPDLLLSVLATALVALGLEPLRSRIFPPIAHLPRRRPPDAVRGAQPVLRPGR